MRRISRAVAIGTVLLAASAFSGAAFAGKSFEEPDVQTQSNAGGTKLHGVMFIEFQHTNTNMNSPSEADAIAVVRLRQGNDVQTFRVATLIDNSQAPDNVQTVLTPLLEPLILDGFFLGEPGLEVILKSLSDLSGVNTDPGCQEFEVCDFDVLMDITLAVRPAP